MDTSVTSIEAMAREFGKTLYERGFSKGLFHEFRPYQPTDVLVAAQAVIGIILRGELLIQFQDCLIINAVGDQFFVPANTHYQVTAGEHGAQFLLAKYQSAERVL
jgi:hypothetical protein